MSGVPVVEYHHTSSTADSIPHDLGDGSHRLATTRSFSAPAPILDHGVSVFKVISGGDEYARRAQQTTGQDTMADGSGSTNRFTLTDYEYDRDANARAVSRSVRLTQEEGLENRDMANATASSSRGTAGGRALPTGSGSYENEDGDTLAKGKSTSSNGSTGQRSDKGRLRLHQPTERPVYPPKPNTITSAQMVTSPVESMSAMSHISSSGSGVLHAYPRSASTGSQLSQAGPSSPSTSAIRPLPPLPRSFSSSTSITSPLSPTAAQSLPQTPSRSHPMSPPLSEFNDSLTPRLADHRPVSDAWSSQDVEVKEKGESQEDYFSSRPALVTRPSGTDKVLTVWQKFFPASWPCRLLLLTVILETLIDITIEGNILWRFNAEVDSGSASYLRVENSRRLPVYLVIYGLAHLWQLVLTFVAVRSRNTVQVVAVTAFNFAFLGYAVIQIYELRQLLNGDLEGGLTSGVNENDPTLLTLPLNVLTAVVIGVVAGGCVALVILSYFIRKEFG